MAGLLLLALAVGIGLGRASAPPSEASPTPPMVAGPGPSRVEQGVPRGFASTQAGAVAAAGGYVAAIGDRRFLDLDEAREAFGRFMAPELAAQQLHGVSDAARLADDPGTAQRIQPLGYRVEAFEPGRAEVAVWSVVVVEGPVDREQVGWFTDRLNLRWSAGDWLLVDASSQQGPSPSFGGGSATAEAMNGFTPYTVQPGIERW